MWDALMDWLPNLVVGTLELRDVMNLVLAAVSLILAGYAIRMGRQQVGIGEEQMRIARVQLETAVAMSERRPSLALSWSVQLRDEADTWVAEIEVRNSGKKPVENVRWEMNLMIWRKYEINIPGAVQDNNVHSLADAPGDNGQLFRRMHGYVKEPIYPRQVLVLGTLLGKMNERPVVAYWRIDTAEGPFPADANYGRLSLFDWETDEEPPDDDEAPVDNS